MSNSEAWAILAGILLPLLVSLIKQVEWPRRAKVVLAIGLSLAAGLGASLAGDRLVFDWQWALMDAAIVFAEATAIYKLWFEDKPLDKALTRVGSDIL